MAFKYNKQKIAMVCEFSGTKREGGEHYAMLRLAEKLCELGQQVNIYSYVNKNPNLQINSIFPLRLRLLPFIRDMFFFPFTAMNLLKKIDKEYNIILASTTTIASFYKPKSKLVIICHIVRTQKFEVLSKIPKYKLLFNPIIYRIMYYLEKRSLHNASKLVVIKPHQKHFLTEKFGINPNKITILPNGIDVNLFQQIKGITKKNQIIFVGRGTIPKGLDTLLTASKKINANILIVTNKIDPNLRTIAETLKNVTIKYHANASELAKLYSESLIFALPSLDDERQTLATMEAMACGLPVVVTKRAGGDIVESSKNGFIISERNPEQLAEKINLLLKNKHLRENMAKNNRRIITKRNNLTKIAIDYSNLINN